MKKITLGFATFILVTLTAQAASFTTTQYVKVQKSKAKYENVIRRTPYEECWDERVPIKKNHHRRDRNYDGFGTLIGGVAGGIIGNQVGKGRGKTVATIGGALIGSLVGNNLSHRNYDNNSYSYTTYETRRRCTTHYNERRERKFVGYKNIGFFKGRKIVKCSSEKLDYIPVTITVEY
ncbi:MAG: glycine zipper 2TM domain-containing protein [Sulfurospirillum sp.]